MIVRIVAAIFCDREDRDDHMALPSCKNFTVLQETNFVVAVNLKSSILLFASLKVLM